MSLNYPNVIHAAGATTGSSGAAIWQSGAVAARSAKGVYTLTLDNPADAAECAVLVTVRGATEGYAHVVQTSDTVKTVNTVDNAGAAQDVDFDWLVIRAPGT